MSERNVHVLHVDDERGIADLATTYLERHDDRFTTDIATSAQDGLKCLSNGEFDCVISDYDMPEQNGIEFLRNVREQYPDLPFILYTGKGSETVASEAISAGVTDYLQKETGTEQYELLANRVNNAVQARRHAENLAQREELMRLTEIAGGTGGWELDLATDEVQLTTGMQRLLGMDCEYVSLTEWLNLYSPEARTEAEECIQRVIDTREQISGTWKLRSNGDTDRRVEVTIVPVVTNNEVTAVRGAINDITQYRERERELKRTRERMEYALRETNSKIFEIDPETNEETRYGPFEEIYDVPSEDLTTTEEFLSTAIHPADRQRVEQKLTEVFEQPSKTVVCEYRTHPDNGDVRWLQGRASGRTDADGDITAVVGVSTEITAHKQRERELQRHKQFLESINDAVFAANQDGTIVYANNQSAENVGTTTEEVIGESLWPLVREHTTDSDGVERFREAFRTALDADSEEPDTVRLTLEVDGSKSVFEYRFSRVTPPQTAGEADTDPLVTVVARDVTDQVQRTKELQRTQELLTEMERTADIGAWEYDPSADEVTRTAGINRLYDVDPDTELSVDDALKFYHPEDRPRLKRRFQRCIEDGEPYELDLRVIGADGERRWVTTRGERVQTYEQERVVRGYVQDISAEKARIDRLQQIETLFENAQDMLFIIDHSDDEFVVQRVNEAFENTTGLSNEYLSGKSPREIFGEERGARIENKYRQCVETAEPLTYEETVSEEHVPEKEALTEDGLTYWETRIAPVEADGSVEAIVGSTRDINERKRRERELERRNERLDEFAGIVSHDLQSPLTTAGGYLELAQDTCENDYIDRAANAIDRSQALIDDLLLLARYDAEARDLDPIDLVAMAENCWKSVDTRGATLETTGSLNIYADESWLEQLFENLYRNAIEHGGKDVVVSVGVIESDPGFYVADDGSGVPQEDRDRVFESGYSTSADGTGYGLSIVEKVVRAHGWTIDLTDSEAGGARFEITAVESSVDEVR